MKRRPTALIIGTSVLALSFAFPFINLIRAGYVDPSIIPFLVFGLLPSLFVIYRVLMADQVARAAVTVMCLTAIGFGTLTAIRAFSTEMPDDLYTSSAIAADGVSNTVTPQTRQGFVRGGIISSLFALCITLGLVALYLPRSNRWFRPARDP